MKPVSPTAIPVQYTAIPVQYTDANFHIMLNGPVCKTPLPTHLVRQSLIGTRPTS